MNYHVGVFPPTHNPGNTEILRKFAAAIRNDYVTVHSEERFHECDVMVVYGGIKRALHTAKNKSRLFREHKGPVLIVERGFLKRGDDVPGPLFGQQGEYFSVGWNGIGGRADYWNAHVPGDRWRKLAVTLKPWSSSAGPVLVCGQVPWDVTVQHTDHLAWCQQTVDQLLQAGYKVRFRPHPYAINRGVRYGVNAPLDMLPADVSIRAASWVVTYSSTIGVQSVIAGTPTVSMDRGSMVWDVTAHSIEEMKHFALPDRTRWAEKLAYTQWQVNEFEEAWNHVRGWLGQHYRPG